MTCGNAKEVAFVVGGGIGGLAAALALHDAGYDVKVFEQAKACSEIGAGINVLPVGVKVLTSLGLLEKLIGTGPKDGAAIQTSDLVYCAPSGAIVLKEKRGKSAGHSSPQLSVHRGWLHRAMFEAVKERIGEENVLCGHVFSTYTQDDEKVTCVFKVLSPEERRPNQFTATKSYDAAFMIGADGVKSGVRAVMSEDKAIYTGWRIYRGVLEIDSQMYDGRTMLTYGTGKCASVLYPVSEKKRLEGKTLLNWGINCHESILAKELQGVPGEEDWTRKAPKSEFQHLVDGWVFPQGCFPDSTIDFTKLINDTADNNVTCYALHDRDPIKQWTHGRVTLLGDSAHPLLPFGSTGAGQALLDVEALQLELKAMPAGGDCRTLLKAYEKARVDRAAQVVLANREMGPTRVLKMFEDAVGTKPLPEQEKWVEENTEEIVNFSNSFQKLSGLCKKDEVTGTLENYKKSPSGGSPSVRLRRILDRDGCITVPGVGDALSARIAHQELGFEVLFVSGFAVSASLLGQPDVGMLGFADMAAQVARIRVAAPGALLIVDGDTGYGGPAQVKRTVQGFGNAGAACVMIEDQVAPKQCGHTEGKQVVSFAEACARVQAAVDARDEMDDGPLIMARSDARVQSEEECLKRGRAFAKLGADIVFLEAPLDEAAMRADCAALPNVHKMANLVEWAKTPLIGKELLNSLGYKIALHPVLMLNASSGAMHRWAKELRDGDGMHDKRLTPMPPESTHGGLPPLMDFSDLQRTVGFPQYFKDVQRYRDAHDRASRTDDEPDKRRRV